MRISWPIFGIATATAAACLALAACGASESGPHPDYAAALAGSPPRLAALHKQANRLLPGGQDAFNRRLRALKGYPVVVNAWASWCGTCRYEFPALQQVAARYGKRVAFLGVDVKDSDHFASSFLGERPVPYPSYVDSGWEIPDQLGISVGLPGTAFFNRAGKLVYTKQGAYYSTADLAADVRRYALD